MGSINFLASPKRPDLMKLFKAPEGWEIGQADCSAVEPRIMAQLSGDKALMSVYGKKANPSADIYLTTGSKLSIFKDKILQYYDPNNPTKEGVALAKEHCDEERSKSKIAFLGYIYGQREGSLATGMRIPYEEAAGITADLDRGYSGLVAWKEELNRQWAKNRGYLINARGIPMGVDRKARKDQANRVVQSSGVMILRRIVQTHLPVAFKYYEVDTRPLVPNYHDEFLIAVRPGQREQFTGAVNMAYKALNDELDWDVEIKHGGVRFASDFTVRTQK